jgi:hypothetical protein
VDGVFVRKSLKFERAIAIRDRALKLIELSGYWETRRRGPDVKSYDDDRFTAGFYIRPTGVSHDLYALDLWDKHSGKVFSLAWNSVGSDPKIISFNRGEWETLFLNQTIVAVQTS